MVADDPRRDRGQLILVGCLALALVIIGIGAVINTTLYTESASPALSNVQVDDASTFNLETRRGTRGLVHRINHGDPVRDRSAIHDQVQGAVGNYSELLAVSYARTEPASVDVAYRPGNSKLGTRAIQRADAPFDSSIDSELNADQQFGWFAMNVNVSGTGAGAPFGLTMASPGPNPDTVRWEIQRNVTGETANLTIETTYHDDSAGTTAVRTAHCNPVRNRVLVDGFTGQIVADACVGDDRMFGIDRLEPPHRITAIDQADEFHGTWELVTNETEDLPPNPNDPRCDTASSPPRTDACLTPVVWTANVTTAYEGQDASFERDRNISVYGGDE